MVYCIEAGNSKVDLVPRESRKKANCKTHSAANVLESKVFQSAKHNFSSSREGGKRFFRITQSVCQGKLYILCFDHCFLVTLLSRPVRQHFLWKIKSFPLPLSIDMSRSQTTSMCYIQAGGRWCIFIYTFLSAFNAPPQHLRKFFGER